MIKKMRLLLGLVTSILALALRAQTLPVSTPEEQGVSSKGIQALVDVLDREIENVHGIVIVRHGHVIAQGWWSPYSADQEHMLFSLSKSFTSTAIGMLVDDGKLSLYDPVLKFFPEGAPAAPSENLKAMRIRDLLIMGTGQHGEDIDKVKFIGGAPVTKQFLDMPVPHKPGTLFFYNTAATYMLSAIVQKVTGQTTLDFLRSRLYEPLGFKDPHWDASAEGISLGGFGMYARTGDIAKFGQMLLQRGEWQGRRLLSANWIEQASARQISNGSNPDSDWDQGYGFQFWRCKPGFYRGDGAFGQFCIVMPQYDTVVAINSGTGDMGGVMNRVWAKLLPELRPTALPADEAGATALKERLAQLALPVVKGAATTPVAARISGKRFTFPENALGIETLVFTVKDSETVVSFTGSGRQFEVTVAPGKWTQGPDIKLGPVHSPVAVSGAWTEEDTFDVRAAYQRLPHNARFVCRFSADTVTLQETMNVGIGGENAPATVVGKAL